MSDILSKEQTDAILNALDAAIESGPWEQSNFLRSIGKSLHDIRDNFAQKISERSPEQLKSEAYLADRLASRSHQQEVFISLYSADGINIQSWEKIIANLPGQMISRPIYSDEEHIQSLIKTKEHKRNEAYVAIYINQTDIITLPPDKILLDKLGHALLTLKDKTLSLENISRFVHVSGIYQFKRHSLIKEQ